MATIQGIYIALFGRPADPLGLAFFEAETQGGANLTAIGDLSATAEYQSRFEGMNSAQIVTAIYESLFGRPPELAGLEFFVAELESGRQNINTIAINILDGAQGDDALVVANKIAAANLWTAAIDADPDALAAYQGQVGIDAGAAFLAGITADPDTVPTEEEVDAAVAALVSSVDEPIGQTFTLTDAIGEQVVGTDANDTFVGVLDGATDGTFQIGDQIDGKGGTDTFNLFVTSNSALPVGSSVKNVEIINLIEAGGTVNDLSAAAFVGATQVWQVNDSADIAGVGAGVTVGFRDHEVAAAITFTGATGDIALDGAEANSELLIFGANLATLNISGTVGMDGNDAGDLFLESVATKLETLNLALTSDAVIGGLTSFGNLPSLVTFDASASTGSLTINFDLDRQDDLVTIKLGSGNDVINVDWWEDGVSSLTTIDLGAGNDILTLGSNEDAFFNGLSITLGAGFDTVIFDARLMNIQDEDSIITDIIQITDFNGSQDLLQFEVGGDRVTLTGPQTGALNTALADDGLIGGLEYLAGIVGNEDVAVFQFEGSTYIFKNDGDSNVDGGEGLLQLVGFTGTLDASNFLIA